MNNKLQNSLNECLNKVADKNKSTADYNPHDCQCAWNYGGRGGVKDFNHQCFAISPGGNIDPGSPFGPIPDPQVPIFLDPEGEPCENPWGDPDSCCRRVWMRAENMPGHTVNCPSCQGEVGCRTKMRCYSYYTREACKSQEPGQGHPHHKLKPVGLEVRFIKTIKGKCCQAGSGGNPDAPAPCRNPYPPPPRPPSPWDTPGGGGVSGQNKNE